MPDIVHSPALLLHGTEGTIQGGPSVRVPHLAQELRRRGHDAHVCFFPHDRFRQNSSIIHLFNIWPPESFLRAAEDVRVQQRPLVISPILIDHDEAGLWQGVIPALFRKGLQPVAIDAVLSELAQKRNMRKPQIVLDYGAMVREVLSTADHVILLSKHERNWIDRAQITLRSATIIRNAVDSARFAEADPSAFHQAYGITDFVLCVARIEPRKNQLLLLHALRDFRLPIVLVGAPADLSYFELLRPYLRRNVHILGRINLSSPLLASAYAAARVVILPSWAEGASLAALEAAASGANLVLSDNPPEREYFGDHATYCNPLDPASIQRAVCSAYDTRKCENRRAALKQFVTETYSWERHVTETIAVYHQVAAQFACRAGNDHPIKSGMTLMPEGAVPANEITDFREAVAMGDWYRDQQSWAEAVRYYRQATQISPAATPIWVQMGHMLKESGELAEAETCYRRAMELSPEMADPVFQLGHLKNRVGQFAEAYTYYRQALRLEPFSADIRRHTVLCLNRMQELGMDLPTPPGTHGCAIAIGQTHLRQGYRSLAVESYEIALLRDPDDIRVREELRAARGDTQG